MPQLLFGEHKAHFQAVVAGVLRAADPGQALMRCWPKDDALAGELRGAVLVAAGKASLTMTRAAVEQLGVRPSLGLVLAPAGSKPPPSFHAAGVRVFEVDHPLPTQRNLIAARAAGDAARLAGSRKLTLLVLLSGGASAHLTVPDRGLTLSDIRTISDALLKSGAPIGELNAVRSCCEQLKAGGLARLAHPSPVRSFILADVLGDPPPVGVIGSGPTADAAPSPSEAIRVLEAHGLAAAAPNITAHIRARVGAPIARPVTNATNTIIGSNASAVIAARTALEELGFAVIEARTSVEGEAREMGDQFASLLLAKWAASSHHHAIAVVWGGECTVNVAASPGVGFGGRNQEAALAAALKLAGTPNVALMCFATDGVDGAVPPGQSPHAGAIVTGETVTTARRSAATGLAAADPDHALATHSSYGFMQAAEAALKAGPTGTNVNDIWVGLAYP